MPISTQRLVAEATAVFVVHIQQEEAKVGPRFQDFVEQQRHTGRFADAGGAKNCEVLADEIVDVDVDASAEGGRQVDLHAIDLAHDVETAVSHCRSIRRAKDIRVRG